MLVLLFRLGPSAKVRENGSLDFLAFRHGVRGPKCEENYTARFLKKKSVRPRAGPLGPKRPKIEVFRTLRENGSNDFAHLAYLDRSHQYLQLFYWHHGQKKFSLAFRGHFRSKNSVFWTFFKKYCSDRSDIAYLDRSYRYLQLLYWHHARENTSRAFIGHFVHTFPQKRGWK